MKTLLDLNANATTREWGKYTLRRGYAVGRNGRQMSYRGTTGRKLHLLRTDTVIADRDPQPRTYKVGDFFSVQGVCAANGQNTGVVVKGVEPSAVTCKRCLAALALLNAQPHPAVAQMNADVEAAL